MNELRMYVEHLFEGKVLTAENIELKEEIYGNLVARYEDLIAGGASREEALERTKESMKSLDEMYEPDDAPAAATTVIGADCSDDAPAAATAVMDADCSDEAERLEKTQVASTPVMPAAIDEDASAQGEPSCAPERALDTSKVLKYALIAFAAVVVLGLVAKLMFGCVNEAVELEEDQPAVVTVDPAPSQGAAQTQGAHANASNGVVTIDEAGHVFLNGEPGDDLLASVVEASSADVAPYVDTKLENASAVEGLLRALPLGEAVTDIDTTKGVGVLGLAYRDVPEAYDGDSVDIALGYNAAALFCAMPLVNEIQIIVTEEGEPLDESYYVFTRDDVQSAFGVALSGELVNESGWRQLKDDHLFGRKFAERLVETAENEWR